MNQSDFTDGAIHIQSIDNLGNNDIADIIVAQIVELRGTDDRFDKSKHFILKEYIYT